MRTALAPALVFAAAQLAFAGVVLLWYLRYGLMLWRQVRLRVWWGGGTGKYANVSEKVVLVRDV
jgi:hypothetical protein